MQRTFPRCYFASRELIDGSATIATSDKDRVNTPHWRHIGESWGVQPPDGAAASRQPAPLRGLLARKAGYLQSQGEEGPREGQKSRQKDGWGEWAGAVKGKALQGDQFAKKH